MRSLRSVGFVALQALLVLAPTATGYSDEEFYGLWGGGVSSTLVRFDQQTGQIIASDPIQTASPFPLFWGLTYDGERLLTNNRHAMTSLPDHTFSIHPADATANEVGPTGHNWNFSTYEVHPLTGVLYAIWINELFVVDRSTGAATSLGLISGLSGDCICGFAIDSQGNAYGGGSNLQALYSLDLATRTATHLGDLALGVAGEYLDLAFNQDDELWGTFSDVSHGTAELHRLDPVLVSRTVMLVSQAPLLGIAFGPATEQSTYCTAKTNSLGCVPAIDGEGLASATGTAGYDVRATNVRNNTLGWLLYSLAGPASQPFKGGTLCLSAPVRRASFAHSGGSPRPAKDCTGTWSLDLNTFLFNEPWTSPGMMIRCQWMGRDGRFPAPNSVSLTDALEVTLRP